MNASERYGGDRPIKADIVFIEDRCMHRKSVFAQCGPCVEACPSHAIRQSDEEAVPSFDPSQCLHCGTCLASCPFEAFQATNFSERKMLKRIAGTGPVRVRCWLPQGELSALGSSVDNYQAAVCLAALTPAALFSLARDRVCVVATARCEACALYRTAGPVLRQNLHRARLLLGDWHREANLIDEGGVAFASAEPSEKSVAAPEAVRGPLRSTARALFHRWSDTGDEAAETEDARSVKRHVIGWRSLLEQRWREADSGQTDGGVYPWPMQVVDVGRCVACGTCASMCPTRAISLVRDAEGVSYRFNAGRCSECGLCARSCPQQALTRTKEARERPFNERECFYRAAVHQTEGPCNA